MGGELVWGVGGGWEEGGLLGSRIGSSLRLAGSPDFWVGVSSEKTGSRGISFYLKNFVYVHVCDVWWTNSLWWTLQDVGISCRCCVAHSSRSFKIKWGRRL